jgi:pimeloyl-ACP methyl ester carboxylesterase/DNA-binding winged helix-turn-helix (wHTH) protein
VVDPERFELRRQGIVEHVEPQVFDVLVYLIRHRDRVVTKAELLDNVWGDRFVSESALASRLKSARRGVGDDGSSQRIIRTVFGRGYQFVAPVVERELATAGALADGPPMALRPPSAVSGPPLGPLQQAIRFCTASDGARIAFATMGTGPVLVKAANWLTHLDYDGETQVWRHWLDGLARGRTLVRYDERGCGLSDWNVDHFNFDDWVDDLELVVDAVGLERFPLLGVSQGAATAVAFAARHPERVTRLILAGAYGRGRLMRATTDEQRREAAFDLEVARIGWGRDDPSFRQMFTSQFLPDGTREQWEEFNELQRRTTSAHNAVRFLETFSRIDVTAIAPEITCPTLMLHSRDDRRVPLSTAKELAALIPGARLVSLHSRNHILTSDEPAWPVFLREIDEFLAADA